MQKKNIILASASPRRRELLAQAGYKFEIQVSHKEEHYTSTQPDEIVKELALLKARDIAEGLFISSRAVSGAMRKLVTDGFVEKVGQDPVIYSITDNGKNIDIE